MKRNGNYSWGLLFLLGLALVVLCEMNMVDGANVRPGQCKEERRLLINLCKPVVFGQSPTPACCERVRASNYECVCPVVDAKLAALITLNLATKTLQTCNRIVPHHFNCGSIYFP